MRTYVVIVLAVTFAFLGGETTAALEEKDPGPAIGVNMQNLRIPLKSPQQDIHNRKKKPKRPKPGKGKGKGKGGKPKPGPAIDVNVHNLRIPLISPQQDIHNRKKKRPKPGKGKGKGKGKKPKPVCKYYKYKNWYELISPCFKQLINNKHPKKCHIKVSPMLESEINEVIEELNETVTNNPTLTHQAELMWTAVQNHKFHEWCPGSFQEIVHYLKVVLTQAPPFLPNAPNLYGVPIANMLLCYLHTEEGRSFFASPLVNAVMIKIVDTYGKFLETKESLNVLNRGTFGWQSTCALKALNNMTDFVYDPNDRYWGFKSWNGFFTRKLKKGVRPIFGKGNNTIIDAFGDNGFYHIEMNLQNNTKLWMKNESYSLFQMFDKNSTLSDKFIGGTALQVFFSATKYHHFHAPVSGNVTYAANKHGIIYAVDEVNVKIDLEKLTTLQNWVKYGADGIIDTQLYLAHITSRAIIIIENELLGPVALFFVGMTEISSCRIEPHIKKGYEDGKPVYVEKGDELGHFQYGGSTGAILLTKDVVEMKNKNSNCFWDMTLLTDDIKMGQPILVL